MQAVIDWVGAALLLAALLFVFMGALVLFAAVCFGIYAITKLMIQRLKGGKEKPDRELLP